jgi:hypothetical protein
MLGAREEILMQIPNHLLTARPADLRRDAHRVRLLRQARRAIAHRWSLRAAARSDA